MKSLPRKALLACVLLAAPVTCSQRLSQSDGGGDGDDGLFVPAFDGDGSGGPQTTGFDGPSCAEQTFSAEPIAADVALVVDGSASMNLAVSGAATSKWQAIAAALASFVGDPRSSGLGVAMQFFPKFDVVRCMNDANCGKVGPCQGGYCAHRVFCDLADFSVPIVPLGDLPGAAAGLTGALAAQVPDGPSPMGIALYGMLAYLHTPEVTARGRRVAMVLATDGGANTCQPEESYQIADLLKLADAQKPPIPTYVIGVADGTDAGSKRILDLYAAAGGTKESILVAPGKDLTAEFLAALNAIREIELPCDYKLPAPQGGALDFGKVNLAVTTSTGDGAVIGFVPDKASCHPTKGGWYFDVDPRQGTPTKLTVCPTTCYGFKQDNGSKVELRVGCQTKLIE